MSSDKNGRNHTNGIVLYVFASVIACLAPLLSFIAFAYLSQTNPRGRQERYQHPHFIGGEAEAGPPNSRRSLGSWVS